MASCDETIHLDERGKASDLSWATSAALSQMRPVRLETASPGPGSTSGRFYCKVLPHHGLASDGLDSFVLVGRMKQASPHSIRLVDSMILLGAGERKNSLRRIHVERPQWPTNG